MLSSARTTQRCQHCGSVITHFDAAGEACARCLLDSGASIPPSVVEDFFGDYQIICEIGEGGMGIVYLAEQNHIVRREVALKALKAGLDTKAVLSRFETERHALALMNHPNIATFYDAGASRRGRPYFVMEFVDGQPITEACDRHGCTIPQRLALFVEVCRAIEHAHRKGIVHRDIKPSNVLVAEVDGGLAPKVIDFGIARAATGHLTGNTVATAFGELLGTPEYMSPEQAGFDSQAIGPASDTYSLGVLLYELLTGVLPFDPIRLRASGLTEAIRIIREEEAPAPAERLRQTGVASSIAERRGTNPETLRRVLLRDLSRVLTVCLQKDPKRRYASVARLADDIERYLRNEPVLAAGPTFGYRAVKTLKRYRVSMRIAACAILAAGAAALWFSQRPSPPVAPLAITPLISYAGTELQPSFSPDGKQFAFIWDRGTGSFNIYRKPVATGSPLRLTTGPGFDLFPEWSPDRHYLAFVRVSSKEKALYVIPAGGGLEREITPLGTQELRRVDDVHIFSVRPGPAWSHDGKSLVISDFRERTGPDALYEYSIDGRQAGKLTTPEAGSAGDFLPAFSPDGRSLAFVRNANITGYSSIFVLERNRRALRRIFSEDRRIAGLAWMSNDELLFSSNRSGPFTLWRVSIHGGAPLPIRGAGSGMTFISYSRGAGRIAFAEESSNHSVWRIGLQKGKATGVPEKLLSASLNSESAEFSPDSKAIVFVSSRFGVRQIWTADADGSNARQLTAVAPDVPVGTPRWSFDGRHIAYDTVANGHAAIGIMNADGSRPHIFTNDGWDDMMPAWSHDGQWIYFACKIDGTVEVCRKAAVGGPTMRITTNGGGEARESPDGRFLIYARPAGIWQVPRDGGAGVPLPGLSETQNARYWTIAGDAMYLLRGTRKPWTVYRYDLTTHQFSKLATIEKKPNFSSPGLAVSPDLTSLLVGEEDQVGDDIVMIEGVYPH